MFAGARVFIHPLRFYQLHIVRERWCLFKNKFLKWFLRDLSQQRGQEKSIHPSLFHSSSLPPTLLSSSLGSFTSVPRRPPVSALYLPPLFSTPLCDAPVATAGQVFVGEQTDLRIYPSARGSVCFRVAAGAINIRVSSFVRRLCVRGCRGWAGRHYRQGNVMHRKWRWGREGGGGDAWGRVGRKRKPAVLNPRETTREGEESMEGSIAQMSF